jgi:predicted permease
MEFGDEMSRVFSEALQDAQKSGATGSIARLWMRETVHMAKFAARERLSWIGSFGAGPVGRDIRWAWRGLRARGWTAALSVLLMASALAAGTLVFATADALIFNSAPFPEPDQLVSLGRGNAQSLRDFRDQEDLIVAAGGSQPSVTFLGGDEEPERVNIEYFTPGVLEVLQVVPRWGRPFVDSDRVQVSPSPAILTAGLATARFGRAEAAVGQILETSEGPLQVVGVMPTGFRYPNGRVRIWRVLDQDQLSPMSPSMQLVARLAPGMSPADASTVLTTRLPDRISKSSGKVAVTAVFPELPANSRSTMIQVLLGAAVCLLLAACANITSLELAGALRRAQSLSIRSALGASRGSLIRTVILESAVLAGLATLVAVGLALAGTAGLMAVLPEAVALRGVNPVDVDARSLRVLGIAACGVWLIAVLPVALHASRSNVAALLKSGARGATVSRLATLARRAITVAQVALAAILLIGGLLYMRSYFALLGIETGMQTTGVYSLSITTPDGDFPGLAHQQLTSQLLDDLEATPIIEAVASQLGSAPPGNTYTTGGSALVRGDGVAPLEGGSISIYDVEPRFFNLVGIAPLRGRLLVEGDSRDKAVITETFARRAWGSIDVIGQPITFRNFPDVMTIVGVVPHVRTERDEVDGPSDRAFTILRMRPPAPPQPPSVAPAAAGPEPPPAAVNAPSGRLPFRVSSILVKLAGQGSGTELVRLARSIDSRAIYRAQSLDDVYAERHQEVRMASAIVTSFAVVAFGIATAGVFGVMAFLVSQRTREIGIRMALGAGRRDVRRLVLRSSLRLIVSGVIVGVAGAALASRWLAAQFVGISATDPATYLLVGSVLTATALVATWLPARRAAQVDPATTLRAE